MTRTEGSAIAASMLGRDDTIGGDVASGIYGSHGPNGHAGIVPGQRWRSLGSPVVRPRERKLIEMVTSRYVAKICSIINLLGGFLRVGLACWVT